MAEATLKEQLGTLFKALNVSDINSASAAIADLRAASDAASSWKADQQAFFDIAGASDQAAALQILTQMKADHDTILSATGAKDHAGVIAAIDGFKAAATENSGTIASLTSENQTLTTQNGQLNARVTELTAAQSDFDKKVDDAVIARIASTGLPMPIEKPKGDQSASSNLTGMDRVQAAIAEQLATQK